VQRQERDFDPDPDAVTAARKFVQEEMTRRGYDASDVSLVVTELVTNAVQHARTPFRVAIWLDGGVAVEVADQDPRSPVVVDSGPESVRGRGLRLVDALARAWGALPTPEGKTVWALLDLQPIA
jgi:anti-sigma regulatory factor (Ser/Thr protein kinase)